MHLCTCVALIVCLSVGSADIFTNEEANDIKNLLEQVMGCVGIPGLSMAVVKGDQTWSLPLGYADVNLGRKVTADSLFGIGSISQSITATVLTFLLDKSNRKITFDTPVSDVVDIDIFPDVIRRDLITLKDLLSHRTGYASASIGSMFGQPPMSKENLLRQVLSHLPTASEFRDKYHPNKYMYTVASYVAELFYADKWEQLQQEFLDNLGMMQTEMMTRDTDVTRETYARPYVKVKGDTVEADRSIYQNSDYGPAGSMSSSSNDMIKFMTFILNKGHAPNGTKLIKESSLLKMFAPVVPVTSLPGLFVDKLTHSCPVADVVTGHGLGWFRNVYRGLEKWWQVGQFHSYTTMMWLFPVNDIGIYISINGPTSSSSSTTTSSRITSAMYYITDILLREEAWVTSKSICTFPQSWETEADPKQRFNPGKPKYPLKDYVGMYFSPVGGGLEVSIGNDSTLRINLNAMAGRLVPDEDRVTFFVECDGVFEFLTWSDGPLPEHFLKVKFNRGADQFDSVDISMLSEIEPPIRFQTQLEDEVNDDDVKDNNGSEKLKVEL